MPERIQLRRTKGWRKPEGAVVVSRPSKWGNPFGVVHGEYEWWVMERGGDVDGGDLELDYSNSREEALALAVKAFRDLVADPAAYGDSPPAYPPRSEIQDELRGRDLACWCPLDRPCHADVLLEIANGPTE